MTFHPVTFFDPSTSATYEWPINPGWDAETQMGTGYRQKQIQIERTSNTGNMGPVRQQGDDGAYIINWETNVYTVAHRQALWQWYNTSKKHSIYLTDTDGGRYEGQIITLSEMRVGAAGGPGDIAVEGCYATYVFQFEVWKFLSGYMADAGVLT